jgi:hypothetical protein
MFDELASQQGTGKVQAHDASFGRQFDDPSIQQLPPNPPAREVMLREPDYWADCLHPSNVSRVVFLTHAVSSVLGTNDQQALEAIGVKQLIERYLSDDKQQEKSVALLRDIRLAANGAGSFLGGDRGDALARVFDRETIDILSSRSLEKVVRKVISELKARGDVRAWVTVRGIVGNLPLYQDLRPDFRIAVEHFDMAALLADGPAMAMHALAAASSQFTYFLNGEQRARLEEAWLKLVKHLYTQLGAQSDGELKEQTAATVAMLMEIALMLAAQPGNAPATSRSWATHLFNMLDAAPAFADYVSYDVLERVFQEPASQLHGMYPVLLLVVTAHAKTKKN